MAEPNFESSTDDTHDSQVRPLKTSSRVSRLQSSASEVSTSTPERDAPEISHHSHIVESRKKIANLHPKAHTSPRSSPLGTPKNGAPKNVKRAGDTALTGWLNLRLGDVAPNFTAETNQGPIELYAYKDNYWCLLFSHPADFTPVCTTELGVTAELMPEFEKRSCKVLALSVDSINCHRKWAPDIGEVGGTQLNFPIIADNNLIISTLYTMIHPNEGDTSTVRSVFIIDPANKIRCILTYPKSVGRNFVEILRIIDALKVGDMAPVATPANWQVGDRLIVAPTMSTAEARRHKFLSNVVEVKSYLRWADVAKPDLETEAKEATDEKENDYGLSSK